ncbi:hypothetical protein AAVH_19828 [Aphelenchoides avenae]|nr:hypothetical protein AAVH_19828 [Aphelenchus avenae]
MVISEILAAVFEFSDRHTLDMLLITSRRFYNVAMIRYGRYKQLLSLNIEPLWQPDVAAPDWIAVAVVVEDDIRTTRLFSDLGIICEEHHRSPLQESHGYQSTYRRVRTAQGCRRCDGAAIASAHGVYRGGGWCSLDERAETLRDLRRLMNDSEIHNFTLSITSNELLRQLAKVVRARVARLSFVDIPSNPPTLAFRQFFSKFAGLRELVINSPNFDGSVIDDNLLVTCARKGLRILTLERYDPWRPCRMTESGIVQFCFSNARAPRYETRKIRANGAVLTDRAVMRFMETSSSSHATYDISVDILGTWLNRKALTMRLQKCRDGVYVVDTIHRSGSMRLQIRVDGAGLHLRRGLANRQNRDGFFLSS